MDQPETRNVRRPLRSALLLTGTLLAVSTIGLSAEKAKEVPLPDFAKLEPGMTPEQVRERVGAPKRIARQILYHRYFEQWIYDRPHFARLQFNCLRGRKPQLVWTQSLPAEQGERGPRAQPR
jgi:hypothetical protein